MIDALSIVPPSSGLPNPVDSLAYWARFGFLDVGHSSATGSLIGTLPDGVVAFSCVDEAHKSNLVACVRHLPGPPAQALTSLGQSAYLYHADRQQLDRLAAMTIEGVVIKSPGDRINLPDISSSPPSGAAASVADLDPLTPGHMAEVVKASSGKVVIGTPLEQYSLRGSASTFEAQATKTTPLLENLVLNGQSTLWYAPPNAGKTLLTLRFVIDAITDGRIPGANVYYINADDSSEGVAAKMRLLDDVDAHTLVPGYNGFKASDLISLLREMATGDQARGLLVIIDTIKKFTSLMDKRQSSDFAEACRRFVVKGGTLLALAHTAKNADSNGKLRYAGTTDLLDDFDCAYVITPQMGVGDSGERIVLFEALKRRGANAESAAYGYAVDQAVTYDERFASVRCIEQERIGEFARIQAQVADSVVIEAVRLTITGGIAQKMSLAKAVAQTANVSQRQALRVIDRYTGDDPAVHMWAYDTRERGAKVFSLLEPLAPSTRAAALTQH